MPTYFFATNALIKASELLIHPSLHGRGRVTASQITRGLFPQPQFSY